jgi:phosphatidate phosphatase APP1
VAASSPTGPPADISADDAWWRNLANALRHLETDEVPGVRVRIRFAGTEQVAVTDEEGYFRAWLRPAGALTDGSLWHDADVDVVDRTHPSVPSVRARARCSFPVTAPSSASSATSTTP